MYKLEELNDSKVSDLRDIAKKLNISKYDKLKKLELAYAILDYQAEHNEVAEAKKTLEKPQKEISKKPVIKKTPVSKKEKKPHQLKTETK